MDPHLSAGTIALAAHDPELVELETQGASLKTIQLRLP